jgi:hypothetical protein
MSEFQTLIKQAYEVAKVGRWDQLLIEWNDAPVFLNRCSRYTTPGSLWTFLHQAAYFGNEQACRTLISRGSEVEAQTRDGETPANVAERRRHSDVAVMLRRASTGTDSLWSVPTDPEVLPSSNKWDEARGAISPWDQFVAYGGGLVRVPKNTPHFVDSFHRVLVGWHGTFNPPCGMDGEPVVPGLS